MHASFLCATEYTACTKSCRVSDNVQRYVCARLAERYGITFFPVEKCNTKKLWAFMSVMYVEKGSKSFPLRHSMSSSSKTNAVLSHMHNLCSKAIITIQI